MHERRGIERFRHRALTPARERVGAERFDAASAVRLAYA